MRPLITLSAAWVARSVLLILLVGLSGGLVRLLPWLVAPDIPLRLCVSFARLIAAAAFDTAVLVGMPVGMSIAVAIFVERGEARSLFALGVRPAALVRGLIAPALVVTIASVAAASVSEPEPPGRFARGLIETARTEAVAGARRVEVPVVSMSWLDLREGPLLAGRVPGVPSLWVSARTLEPDDSFRAVALSDVHVAGALGARPVSFAARRVSITGIPGWDRQRLIVGPLRGLLVSGCAVVIAFLAAWLLLLGGVGPIAAAASAAAASIVTLEVLRTADARLSVLTAVLAAPVAGSSAIWLSLYLARAFGKRRVARRRAR